MTLRPIGDYQPTFRDKVAHRLANWALRIGTPRYRKMVEGSMLYGMNAAARDEFEGRPPPAPWEETAARWLAEERGTDGNTSVSP